jgi:hypothetical protein
MQLHRSKTLPMAILVGIMAIPWWGAVGNEQPAPLPVTTAIEAGVPQTLPIPTVMHAKLHSTQQVLTGLVAEDYSLITAAAIELHGLARDVPPQGDAANGDAAVYGHFRDELLRLTVELRVMGEDRNLNGAAYVHQQITATCIGCHRQLRTDAREIQNASFDDNTAR